MQVTILGKRWTLKHDPRLPCDLDGMCDNVSEKNRTIRIHASLTGAEHLAGENAICLENCRRSPDDTAVWWSGDSLRP